MSALVTDEDVRLEWRSRNSKVWALAMVNKTGITPVAIIDTDPATINFARRKGGVMAFERYR